MTELMSQEQLYDNFLQVILAASQLPFVKVNRIEFLKKELKNSKYLDIILSKGPQTVYSTKRFVKGQTE